MATDRMIIWSGISQLDGETPIVVLATGVPRKGSKAHSGNAKTGDMIQINIMVDGIDPRDALATGADKGICGTCPHRSPAAGGSGACYVHPIIKRSWGQTGTMNAHLAKGSVEFDLSRFEGHKVRFGAYGDPAAVPFEVWEPILDVASDFTSYTHAWKTADRRFARFCMASADTADEGREARKLGYRNFIVRPIGSDKPKGAIVCPASAEAGKKLECNACMMCGGNSSKQTRDITIIAHGAGAKKFTPAS